MSIPGFSPAGVLPPYVGDPASRQDRSPYVADAHEFVRRFGTSVRRCEILQGWLKHRRELYSVGIRQGFQWLDGSFCEDLTHQSREPGDIDVLTFYEAPTGTADPDAFEKELVRSRPYLVFPKLTKQAFHCDAYFVQLDGERADVELVSYWFGLFSHRRSDGAWKGIVKVNLDPALDTKAGIAAVVQSLSLQHSTPPVAAK